MPRDVTGDGAEMIPAHLTFGEFVRLMRGRRRMTADELAKPSGISREELSRIENDRVKPLPETEAALLEALGTDKTEMARMVQPGDVAPRGSAMSQMNALREENRRLKAALRALVGEGNPTRTMIPAF